MQDLLTSVRGLGVRRLAIMGGVALALMVALAALTLRGPSGSMGFLYTDLEPSAAQGIAEKLKAQGVAFELSADGTSILAPLDKLPALRMDLASERLGGKIGYDVLDQEEPFGISSSRARINETRAIEGELSRSIESLDHVSRARVHIVMPERDLFATQARKASAAVTLRTDDRLTPEAIQAIRYLVSSSVPDLSPSAVSIVDQTGALLARAGEEAAGAAGDLDAQQTAIQARLRSQIETMLEPIVGPGKVRAEVAAVLNRDQTREESEAFDPDKQVVGHQVTVESDDQSDAKTAGAEGVSVGTQLPDAAGPITGTGTEAQRSARKETSEDVTYQNSRTQTVAVRAPGRIDRLSVAVMVDGGATGLPPAQMQRLTRLVETAVGFDPERGDSVVVEAMRFSALDAIEAGKETGLPFGITGGELLGFLKWVAVAAGIAIAGVLVRRRLVPAPPPALPDDRDRRALPGGTTPMQLEDKGDDGELATLDEAMATARLEGEIRASTLLRIGETVANSPAESAAVIRQWMNG